MHFPTCFWLFFSLLPLPLLLIECHSEEKRQLILPQFVLRSERQQSTEEPQLQQMELPIVPAQTPRHKYPKANNAMRPCYFSPIQCLLRTPGQYRVFENHPQFNNHFRAKSGHRRNTVDPAMFQQHRRNSVRHPQRHHRHHPASASTSHLRAVAEMLLSRNREQPRVEVAEEEEQETRQTQKSDNNESGKVLRMHPMDGMGRPSRQQLFANPWRIGL